MAYDILQSVWQLEENLVELAMIVKEGAQVEPDRYKQWSEAWEDMLDRGLWVQQEILRLRDTSVVADLWGDGYLAMVKDITKKFRGVLEDIKEKIAGKVEERKGTVRQDSVTEGLHRLTAFVKNKSESGGRWTEASIGRGKEPGRRAWCAATIRWGSKGGEASTG